MTAAAAAARSLRDARLARVLRPPFTDADPGLDEPWGYEVQDLDRAERLAAGERLVGAKLGLTSRAKQRTMGVAQPVVGFLTDAMDLGAGHDEVLARSTQPRVEPEIAFRLAGDLDRPLTPWTAEQAVDAVAVALEVIDSRYAAFGFRLADVVADNTSAAGFLVGAWTRPRGAGDLATAGCVLTVDGTVAHTATGAAVLGHPLRALVHLSAHLARRGEVLPAGSVVLAGALTDAVPVRPGTAYRAEVRGLGPVELVSDAAVHEGARGPVTTGVSSRCLRSQVKEGPMTDSASAAARSAIRSRADVGTGAPARYAKQLISHLGRKVPFTGDGTTSPATARIGAATAGIVVGDGALTLWAAGDDEASVARVEQVLGSHLERFAQREALTVSWVRTAAAAGPSAPTPTVEESA